MRRLRGVQRPDRGSAISLLQRYWQSALTTAQIVAEPIRTRLRSRVARNRPTGVPTTGGTHGPPTLVLCVYRAANVDFVLRLIEHCPPASEVRLWALDEIAPGLIPYTRGVGPGTRFTNLNRLFNCGPADPGSWVVVADDDVIFTRGSVSSVIEVMSGTGLGIAQPGHGLLSWWSSPFTIARPWLRARGTRYVEQGPLIVFSPTAAQRILPLPESDDMYWGIEVEWSALARDGIEMGIVDDVRVIHWRRNATAYDVGPEMTRLDERLRRAGFRSIWDLQQVRWRRWRRLTTPPR